jgi:hypothetical protein
MFRLFIAALLAIHACGEEVPPIPCGATSEEIDFFYEVAHTFDPVSDKVRDHSYYKMYGMYLMPYRHLPQEHPMKILEIGLGCGMDYGPGASVKLWRTMFPNAEIWEAEYQKQCVDHAKEKGMMGDIHVIVGDQQDKSTVIRWVEESGGNFDVIIDDGGHSNAGIVTSFNVLWNTVKPGGVYFIEDMHVGRTPPFNSEGYPVMADVIKSYIDQLIFPNRYADSSVGEFHKIPDDIDFISCQREACVMGKKRKESIRDESQVGIIHGDPSEIDQSAPPMSTTADKITEPNSTAFLDLAQSACHILMGILFGYKIVPMITRVQKPVGN